jgi:hypothetical protein
MSVCAIFDGDINTKPGIQQAAMGLALALQATGIEDFKIFHPPMGKGVDDWLTEDADAYITDLVELELTDMEMSRKQLFATLQLSMNEKGTPIINEMNLSRLIRHRFEPMLINDKRLGIIFTGELADAESFEFAAMEYIQDQVLPHAPKAKIETACAVAIANLHRDLLQELVQGLKWDGVPRLDTWAARYLETDFPAYTNEWGRYLMTGLVLRILQPGTKVDVACILAGAQGIGKSTFFEDLARFDGHDFYHACTELVSGGTDSNRTQVIAFKRSCVVDLAEGVIFETKKTTMDRSKQLQTQQTDEYREVYSKVTKIEKRGFVFVGTTNRLDQLGDATGSRRFLPIYVTNIKKLDYHEKLQIMAEVVAKELAIRESDWYRIRIEMDQVPEAMRENKRHITDVQTLVNTQFARPDAIAEFIVSLLESEDCAKMKDSGELYITAGYIVARNGKAGDFGSKNTVSRVLSQLSSSPTSPYKFSNQRKRLTQLKGSPQMLDLYAEGINNTQLMINGFIVTKKDLT